ncbi:MAG: prolyl oligopeptidase family serine peptidase [Halanaeroarchaeum sp.]
MHDDPDSVARYGTWPSPITAEMVASDGIAIGHVALDGDAVYWREERPTEDGRGVIVRNDGGATVSNPRDANEDVVPDDFDVRTLVHEYGGGDFAVRDGVVYFARYDDQRVYRQPVAGDPEPITPEPETERGLRYADFEVSPDGDRIYCVREDHDAMEGAEGEETDALDEGEQSDGPDEPGTTLVSVPTDGSDDPQVVASGHDFYAAPRLSPDDDRLAWLTWDHPRMPWDGTELHVAGVASDGSLSNERVVMGGPGESVFQPDWRSDGVLHAVSDRTGWWNCYRREGDEWVPYREEAAEYGNPGWQFGLATYAFLDDGRVAVAVTRDGDRRAELLSPDGTREVPELPFAVFGTKHPRIRSDGESVYAVVGGPASPSRLVRWTPGEDEAPDVLRRESDVDLNGDYVSEPEHVTVPTRDGAETHAFVYPPTNPDVEPPADERPPLLVNAHGGPTSATQPTFDLGVQFFTSRGFAVADVNYRGSTGYGRVYREALYGNWGITDVEDCIDVANYLADGGDVDRDRIAVKGGSAGGYVVLSALAFHDDVTAGASYFGVADLEHLAELTHKFESRYMDQLVGPYPEAAETYRVRSPVHHAADVDAPVLLLQGEDDPVVPLSQAEAMADTLAENGVPHDLVVFEGEQHGFRRADSRQRAAEVELAFYGEVFGFDPRDDLPAVDLSVRTGE